MGRRNHNDVFVLGDELTAETTALRNPDPPAPVDGQAPEGPAPPGLGHRPPSTGAAWGPRRLAVLGLAAVAAAALGVLDLASGSGTQPQRPETSSRSAPLARTAPRAASPSLPTVSPSFRPRRPEPSHRYLRAARRRSQIAGREAEREPTPAKAPEPSPTPISPPPIAPEISAPAPLPPTPPPASAGGGAGAAEFSFER